MRTPLGAIILLTIFLLVDLYAFQACKTVSFAANQRTKTIIYIGYWALSAILLLSFIVLIFNKPDYFSKPVRTTIFALVIGVFFAKITIVFFVLIDDIRRLLQWCWSKFFGAEKVMIDAGAEDISRSTFLSWLGLAAGTTLFGSLLYGFRNKYRYDVKNVKLSFKNLPAAFKGLKIVHISDIHSGSFTDKKAVEHGVDMILQQNADLILFTGDLVNDMATEMKEYVDVFNRLKAPMGVYSTLGNHDYGDYVNWPDRNEAHAEKEIEADQRLLTPTQQKNLDNLKKVHANMGWNLLVDEHVPLQKGNDKIALIGVQNTSGKGIKSLKNREGRFYSYGDLAQAYNGADQYPFKILMSHDPSHWEGQVQKKYEDIDLMLSGHTHGMQFGVELPYFKWSPVQYVYKQWAGLYETDKQKLYVNRGFGFIGYPGRVGILPEITVIELS